MSTTFYALKAPITRIRHRFSTETHDWYHAYVGDQREPPPRRPARP